MVLPWQGGYYEFKIYGGRPSKDRFGRKRPCATLSARKICSSDGETGIERAMTGGQLYRELYREVYREALRVLIGAVALSAVLGIFALLQRDLDNWSTKTLFTTLFVSAASLLIMANVAGLEKRSVGYLLISGMGLLAALVALPVFLFALWVDVDGDGLWKFGVSLETISILAGHTSLLSLRPLSAKYRWLKPIATVLGGALAAVVISMIWADDLGSGKLRAAGVLSILLLSVTVVIPLLSRLVSLDDPGAAQITAERQLSYGVRYCTYCGRPGRAAGAKVRCWA